MEGRFGSLPGASFILQKEGERLSYQIVTSTESLPYEEETRLYISAIAGFESIKTSVELNQFLLEIEAKLLNRNTEVNVGEPVLACPHCGGRLLGSEVFCPACGARIH